MLFDVVLFTPEYLRCILVQKDCDSLVVFAAQKSKRSSIYSSAKAAIEMQMDVGKEPYPELNATKIKFCFAPNKNSP